MNYCQSDIKARKTALNRETWIVFSDRDNNDTWQNPGGKNKMKNMSFMEAFFVIREKGDYLQLVKYDPEIVANNPYARIIRNRKKVQYYGWVHRSHLLLTKQSSLDMSTGFKSKSVTIITDTLAVLEPQNCFDSDSVLSYKDDGLSIPNGKIPLHEILYILKVSPDNQRILVSGKTILNPLEAPTEALGWISKSVVAELGQRLFIDLNVTGTPSTDNSVTFLDSERQDTVVINEDDARGIDFYRKSRPEFRYSPARSFLQDSNAFCFQTALPAPVIDRRFTYVLNLNGNKIMYEDLLRLEKDLRQVNLVFVFEGKESVFREYAQIMNVVQNMQTNFDTDSDLYKYRFGAVLSYVDTTKNKRFSVKSCELTSSYAGMLDFLMTETDSVQKYSPIANNQAWRGLGKAVEMIEPYKNETNLLVVIGESGYSEWADSVLVRRIANANGRILGYQTYNNKLSDADNNFVLQIENMIDACSQRDVELRRERLVYASQYIPRPKYRESSRNTYALDYPQRSMTQGWIVFPGKNEDMRLEVLSNALDTLITDARHDNDTVISQIYKAFDEIGNKRYRYDALWQEYYGTDSLRSLNTNFLRRTSTGRPAWLMPSSTITIETTEENAHHYRLLLSEEELAEYVGFLEEITKFKPDYKYKSRRVKPPKPCNCPDDYSLREADVPRGELMYGKDGHILYLNTRYIRMNIYRTFISRLKTSGKYALDRTCRLRRYTLATALLGIAGNPTMEEMMNTHQLREIKSRRKMKDYELDELVVYFNNRKEELKKQMVDRESSFVSNGKTYYWITMERLP
jgi:hypothetical protein